MGTDLPEERIRPRALVGSGVLPDRAATLTLQDADPLAVVASLRREFPEAAPALVAEAASQARLRAASLRTSRSARGPRREAARGLQQASRWAVAAYRAGELRRRLGAPDRGGPPLVADLGCGLGIDALALADAGFRVLGLENDPWTAEAASVNCADHPGIHIVEGDAREADLESCAAAFCDPARRDPAAPLPTHGAGRPPRVGDPGRWSPPWPWVVQASRRLPTVAKASPGIPASAVPADAEREWIEVDGDVVECCVWFAPLGQAGVRRATLLAERGSRTLSAGPAEDRPGPAPPEPPERPDAYLLEPAAVVRRAALVEALAEAVRADGTAARRIGEWLTCPRDPATAWARTWRVAAPLPRGSRALRAALSGFGPVAWKTDAIRESADQVGRRVGHRPTPDGPAATVIMLGDGSAWLAERAHPPADGG